MGETLPYPRDAYRYKLFVKDSNQHQAKMEIRTYIWLMNRYTNPGDTILDPMSGVGTVHLARWAQRNTIGIELMPNFVALQEQNLLEIAKAHGQGKELFHEIGIKPEELEPEVMGHPTILEGDCRALLPLETPADAVIFSPPYGTLWNSAKGDQTRKVMVEKNYNVGYGDSQANVGEYGTYPHYLIAMEIIYQKCFDSLKPGAPLVTVVKDYIQNKRRVYCSRDNLRLCLKVGFEFEDWHIRDASQTTNPFSVRHKEARARAGRDHAELDINREDLLVVRRPR